MNVKTWSEFEYKFVVQIFIMRKCKIKNVKYKNKQKTHVDVNLNTLFKRFSLKFW